MKTWVFAIVWVVTFAVMGCRQHDWRDITIDVPEMHNEAAIRLIMDSLRRGPGIKPDSVVVDPENRRIHFTYDSLLAADMNFIHLIAEAGFTANDIPGDEEARANWPSDVQP